MQRHCYLCLVSCFVALGVSSAHAGMLTTTFASNDSQAGNMFDVLTGSHPLTITGFDLHLQAGTSTTIDVYDKSGDWNTAAPWTLLDTVPGVQSTDSSTPVHIAANFVLAANSRTALYLTSTSTTSFDFLYTTGTSDGSIAAQDANLTILEGAGVPYPLTDPLNPFVPRVWNGTIYYDVLPLSTPEPSSMALMALGGVALLWRRRRSN